MDSSRDIVRKLRESRLLQERKEYDSMSIKDLVRLAQNGDQFAYTTISKKCQDLIYKMTRKYVPEDTFDVDDIQQTAEIGLWQAIDTWDMNGSDEDFEGFAGMIIKRKLIDEYNKLNTEKSKMNIHSDYLDAPKGSDDEGGEMTLGASLPSKGLSPEEEYLGNEGARKITEFIQNSLSDVERQVILKYIDGYKVSEISEEMDMKYKTVENAIMRVKNKLAEYMRNMKESRQLRMNESIFSDEEKEILVSVINKIDNKSIDESQKMSEDGPTTPEDLERRARARKGLPEEDDYEERYAGMVRQILIDKRIPYDHIREEDDVVYVDSEAGFSQKHLKDVYYALHYVDSTGFDGFNTMWFAF